MKNTPFPEKSQSYTPGAGNPARPVHGSTLVAFFGLTFAWAWILWVGMAAAPSPFQEGLYGLGLGGPLFAALVLTARSGGAAGVRGFLAGGLRWRFSLGWYVMVLLGPGILLFLTQAISVIVGIPAGGFRAPLGGWLFALAAQVWVAGAQEYGWRGLALARLQDRFGSLTGALVVGLLWGLWYLPLFLIPLAPLYGQPAGLFLPGVVFNSFLVSLVYNRTGRRLGSVMLLHASANIWRAVLPSGAAWITLILQAGFALAALRYLPRPWFHSRTVPAAPASGLAPRPRPSWLRRIRPGRRGPRP